MNLSIRILLILSAVSDRAEIRAICHYDGKLSLKADEPQVDQRHEDVERKRNSLPHYYFIWKEFLHQERRGQVNTTVMGDLTSILFHMSRPAK